MTTPCVLDVERHRLGDAGDREVTVDDEVLALDVAHRRCSCRSASGTCATSRKSALRRCVVTRVVAGRDRRGLDGDVDRAFERVVGDGDRPGHVGEAAAGLGDHEVADGEGGGAVRTRRWRRCRPRECRGLRSCGCWSGGRWWSWDAVSLVVVVACAKQLYSKSLRAQVIPVHFASWIPSCTTNASLLSACSSRRRTPCAARSSAQARNGAACRRTTKLLLRLARSEGQRLRMTRPGGAVRPVPRAACRVPSTGSRPTASCSRVQLPEDRPRGSHAEMTPKGNKTDRRRAQAARRGHPA